MTVIRDTLEYAGAANVETGLDTAIDRMLRAGATGHSDQHLVELGRSWEQAEADKDAAILRWVAIDDRIARPSPPDELFFRESDRALGLQNLVASRGDQRLWYYLGEHAERANSGLRRSHKRHVSRPVRPEDRLPADAEEVAELVAWPEKQARADEIVQAWDRWIGDIRALEETAGLPPLDAAMREHAKRADALVKQIDRSTAHSLEGLQVKARVIHALAEDDSEVGPDFISGLIRDILAIETGSDAACGHYRFNRGFSTGA